MAAVTETYNAKTFHRKFEETFGHMTADKFPPIDWADQKQIEMLFPEYRREWIAAMSTGAKKASKTVEIDNFCLQAPFGGRDLFKGTSLVIEPNKRCAVYGENGSGKTSIFDAIVKGKVKHFPKYMHTHHMKELEHNEEADKVSVLETVTSSHPFRRVLMAMEPHLDTLIAAETDADRKAKLEENKDYVKQCMTGISGYTGDERAKQSLRVLGFDEVGFVAPLSSLSGGLRMRVALASAFFIDPDLLLLDEPTNHLDMPSVLWLENRLRGYKGSYLLVTHDRTLLENVVTSVMLLQDLKIQPFTCGFAEFEKRKIKLDSDRSKMIEKFLIRNRNLDPCSPEYRLKADYQKWQDAQTQRMVSLAGKFTFKDPKTLPNPSGVDPKEIPLLDIKEVRFSYDDGKELPFIFDTPISYTVKCKTRVGIMGPNGAGKSTFLKLITGKLNPTEGEIVTNPDYKLAYFGQHSTKELKMEDTPVDFMISQFPKANRGELKEHLQKTSVGEDIMNSRMNNLSFSQRSCVIFAKLTFVPPHLLIMDEPTNFLDLPSVDSLIRAANKFTGALIVVTHNRDFLRRCSKHFLSIVPGQFLEFKTMKDAERATYSFITALEEGRAVDAKTAIAQNRGGGAVHTDEERAATQKRLNAQQAREAKKIAEKKAEEQKIKDAAKAKADKQAAKKALQRDDWAAGEKCFVAVKGAWKPATVKRNMGGMGVSCELDSGKSIMVEAKKIRAEDPEAGKVAEKKAAPKTDGAKKEGGAKGGRGGARGGARGGRGGRGGARGGRGGARGGRGGK